LALAFGIVLVMVAAASVVVTLVVPRGVRSRLSAGVDRVVGRVLVMATDLFRSYDAKDRLLTLHGPSTLLALLASWLLLFLAGFALILWPLIPSRSFPDALRQSGSSLFTLGFAADTRAGPVVVYFLAAATGLVVVALQIAYLPTLYGAFNRRESLVT